jgi:hypothetical protein
MTDLLTELEARLTPEAGDGHDLRLMRRAVEEIKRLRARGRRLFWALSEYGSHDGACGQTQGNDPCICGLDEEQELNRDD